jgi:hypothetical protein
MNIDQLGILAADAVSAEALFNFTRGPAKSGLLVLEGPADCHAYPLGCALAGLDYHRESADPCFSTSRPVRDGVAATVVHLGFHCPDPDEALADEVADFLKNPAGNLLVIVALDGEPVELSPAAEAVAVRVKLDSARQLVAAS